MRHNWYTIREALKRLGVATGWISSSDLLALDNPKGGMVIMRKKNRIRPETVRLILDELGISNADFERAYRAASA